MEPAYRVCAPAVVSEVIDGEAIIMDLRSGHYFSTDGSGALVWQAIAGGATRAAILAWAEQAFDAEPARISGDLDAFTAQLVEHGLIEAAQATEAALEPVARGAYRTPVLSVYTDMQDLLLLDPIHDVDEAGWPTRKVEEPQG